MFKKIIVLLLWVIFGSSSSAIGAVSNSPSDTLMNRVSFGIECTCGCGMVLEICKTDEPQCETRPKMLSQIRVLAEAGKSEEEIFDTMGQSLTQSRKAIMKALAGSRYLFLYFYSPSDMAGKDMAGIPEKTKTMFAQKADYFEVNVNNKTEKDIIDKYHAHVTPLIVALSPENAVTGYFQGTVDETKLASAFVSPGTSRIIRGLQNKKVVFLTVQNEKSMHSKESLETLNKVREILGKSVAVVKIDPNDKDEEKLLHDLKVDTTSPEAITIVLSQTGAIGDRFTGDITTQQLLSAFNKVLVARSGCGGMGDGTKSCE